LKLGIFSAALSWRFFSSLLRGESRVQVKIKNNQSLEIGTFFLETSSLKGSWVSLRKPSFWRADELALH